MDEQPNGAAGQNNSLNLLDAIPIDGETSSIIVGILFIIINLRERFNHLAGDSFPRDFRSFRLDDLTSPFRFYRGLIGYLLMITVVYIILLNLGPNILSKMFGWDLSGVEFPLYLALALAGVVPNVRLVNNAELAIRVLAQRFAGVPSDHRFIREKISTSKIIPTISTEVESEIARTINLEKLKQELTGREYNNLIKSRRILDVFDAGYPDHKIIEHISVRVSHTFDTMLQNARWKFRDIETNVNNLCEIEKNQNLGNGQVVSETRSYIKLAVRDLYTLLSYLLSCAVVAETSAKRTEVNQILKDFGFHLSNPVRLYVFDRLLTSMLYAALGVFLISILINGVGAVTTEVGIDQDAFINWIVFTITFFVPAYLILILYTWRRNAYLRRNIKSWYMGEGSFRPRMSKRLKAASVSVFLVSILVPFLDAGVILAEAEEIKSWGQTFPLGQQRYWESLLIYLITPLVMLGFFSSIIENDRRAEYDEKFAEKYFSRVRIVARCVFFGGIAACLHLYVNAMMHQDTSDLVSSVFSGNLVATEINEFVFLAWIMLGPLIGVFVFFYSFIRSGLDVGRTSGAEDS